MAGIDVEPGAVLDGLDPEQRAAAEATRGPVCILAGAGTGKTRAITHRIAYAALTGDAPASQVLAVTFTTRAAGELRSRLRSLGVPGVSARTFHSAALRQLQYFWPRLVGGGFPELLSSKLRPLGVAAARARVEATGTVLKDLAAEVEWAKATLVTPDGYQGAATASARTPPLPADAVARVYTAYEQVKRERDQLDFEDLLLLTTAGLEEHRDVAAEVRARYRYFVVDEYQDVNPLQQRLLDAWLGGRSDLCVVGDPAQTIYSFAGASPRYLLEFASRYRHATLVRLVRDYRSTPQVVDLACRLRDGGAARAGAGGRAGGGQPVEGMVVAAGGGRTGGGPLLVAVRGSGPAPTFRRFADEPTEAAAVAARCRALLAAGTPAREIAVLYRVNAQSAVYESALADADVPFLVRGGERFFDRPEVRRAVHLLRAAARSAGPVVTDADAGSLPAQVTDVLSAAGWSVTAPPGVGAARDEWESLRAIVDLATELAVAEPTADLPAFAAELAERAAAAHPPVVNGVTLATLHAAKGLEWDAVFLVGLVDGTVPIVYAVTEEQIEEERRLLYVGVTRARNILWLSWAAARLAGGRGGRPPSRFLDGLSEETRGRRSAAEAPGGRDRNRRRSASTGGSGRVRCRVCGRPVAGAAERTLGRCAGCPADRDEALYERLRMWRLDTSRQLGQPAYCVFTDATLTAIAELQPSSVDALGDIPGIGPAKLDRYGPALLELLGVAADG